MTELLRDKVCIITGAGKGFGKAIAKKFADNGAKLALITRTQSDIDDLYREFEGNEDFFLAICGDVSDQDTVNSFVADVKSKFGRIDVLVNNAGMRFRKKFEEITLEEFSLILNVNVVSIFMLCKAVMPTMVEQKAGKIINISSVVGTLGLPELSAYATSKAAIIGLTKALSVEYGESNIQVNAIAPGFCKTSYFDNFKKKSELYEFTIERTPMRRWGESEEVANSCLFLASSLSSYVTGDVINVDGGWSAW
ncbi:MAG: NAD(P)-dependent dehydrogenase (short-subunit alcohol dehydrogenase family) [Salibacteraceae bacterium]|jgi:NAD(P)-dependent dehydrogenase (short-subunit alcohol dehydrogenase family)